LNKWAILTVTIVISALMLSFIAFPFPASAQQGPPKDLPDVSKAPFKVKVIEAGELRAEVRPLYTTFGDPDNYETPSGGVYDGVGDLILARADFTVRCSGALLTDGIHVLTAAHCVTDDGGDLNLRSGKITFEGETKDFRISVKASATEVHPDWDGDVFRGNDIAVLKLVSEAPDEITRYDIDRNGDDDVNVGDKAGYGRSGNGDDGDVMPSGTKRDGQNKYDDVADTMLEALKLRPGTDFVPGSVLQYDFDNLDPENDAFGFFFKNPDLGLGLPEVNSAPGDSGGPTLTSDGITGITSYGVRLSTIFGSTSDVDDELNSSFGEFSGDTRVSMYATFIDGVTGAGGEDATAPGAPTLVSPENGFTITDSTPTFDWSDVSDPSGVTYDLRVDNNSDFSSPEIDPISLTVSTFTPTTVLSDGMYSWQARAVDGVGNIGLWSDVSIFTIDTSGGDTVIVSSISGTQIAKGKTLNVVITGSGFQSGASVTFENGCGPSPSASGVSVSGDGTTITADITAKSKGPPKDCAFVVRVTNSGGSTGVLSQLFTVLAS